MKKSLICLIIIIALLSIFTHFAFSITNNDIKFIKKYYSKLYQISEDDKDFNASFRIFYQYEYKTLLDEEKQKIIHYGQAIDITENLTEYKDIPELIKLLENTDNEFVPQLAIGQLSQFKDAFLIPVFINVMYGSNQWIRGAAISYLTFCDGYKYPWLYKIIKSFKDDKNNFVRVKIAEYLRDTEEPKEEEKFNWENLYYPKIATIEKKKLDDVNYLKGLIIKTKDFSKKLAYIRKLGETRSNDIKPFLLDILCKNKSEVTFNVEYIGGGYTTNIGGNRIDLQLEIALALYRINDELYRSMINNIDFLGYSGDEDYLLTILKRIDNYYSDKILISLLESKEHLREKIFEILVRFPSPHIDILLKKYKITINSNNAQFTIIKADYENPEIAQMVLRDLLSNINDDVRFATLAVINKCSIKELIPEITIYINDKNPLIRKEIISTIGSIGPDSDIVRILPYLNDKHSEIKDLTKKILINRGTKEIIPSLINLYKSSPIEVKIEILYIFRKINHPDAIPFLKSVLKDKDEKIRKEAILSLYSLKAIDAKLSKELLVNEQNEEILLTIIRIINWENDKESALWLVNNMSRFNDEIKTEILYTIANSKMEKFIQEIKSFIEKGNPNLKIASMNCLTELKDSSVLDNMNIFKNDSNASVRLNLEYLFPSLIKMTTFEKPKDSLEVVRIVKGQIIVDPAISDKNIKQIKTIIKDYSIDNLLIDKIAILNAISNLFKVDKLKMDVLIENLRAKVIDKEVFDNATHIRDREIIDFLNMAYNDNNPIIKIKILDLLPIITPNGFEIFESALNDPNKSVRNCAFKLIRYYYNDEKFTKYRAKLIKIMKQEPETFQSLSNIIPMLNLVESIPLLHEFALNDTTETRQIRYAAVQNICLLGDFSGIPVLATIYKNDKEFRETLLDKLADLIEVAQKHNKKEELDSLLLKYFSDIDISEARRICEEIYDPYSDYYKNRIEMTINYLSNLLHKSNK